MAVSVVAVARAILKQCGPLFPEGAGREAPPLLLSCDPSFSLGQDFFASGENSGQRGADSGKPAGEAPDLKHRDVLAFGGNLARWTSKQPTTETADNFRMFACLFVRYLLWREAQAPRSSLATALALADPTSHETPPLRAGLASALGDLPTDDEVTHALELVEEYEVTLPLLSDSGIVGPLVRLSTLSAAPFHALAVSIIERWTVAPTAIVARADALAAGDPHSQVCYPVLVRDAGVQTAAPGDEPTSAILASNIPATTPTVARKRGPDNDGDVTAVSGNKRPARAPATPQMATGVASPPPAGKGFGCPIPGCTYVSHDFRQIGGHVKAHNARLRKGAGGGPGMMPPVAVAAAPARIPRMTHPPMRAVAAVAAGAAGCAALAPKVAAAIKNVVAAKRGRGRPRTRPLGGGSPSDLEGDHPPNGLWLALMAAAVEDAAVAGAAKSADPATTGR